MQTHCRSNLQEALQALDCSVRSASWTSSAASCSCDCARASRSVAQPTSCAILGDARRAARARTWPPRRSLRGVNGPLASSTCSRTDGSAPVLRLALAPNGALRLPQGLPEASCRGSARSGYACSRTRSHQAQDCRTTSTERSAASGCSGAAMLSRHGLH